MRNTITSHTFVASCVVIAAYCFIRLIPRLRRASVCSFCCCVSGALYILLFCLLSTTLFAALQKPSQSDITLRDFYNREKGVKERTDAIVDTQIKILTKSLKNIDDSEQKVKFMLRLSELYQEKARSIYFDEVEAYEKQFDMYTKEGKKGPEPKLSQDKSDEYIDKAIALYNSVLNDERYKKYSKKDFVLFQLGISFHGLTKSKEAYDSFQRLIKEFPKSEYIADAYLYVGEYYFDSIQIKSAIDSYKKVLEYREPKLYGYALWKLGWCYYNLDQFDEAIETFKQVVSFSERQEKISQENRIVLKKEALNDLILVFADVGDIDRAENYFSQVQGKDYYYRLLEKLGETFAANGESEKAITTFSKLLRKNPLYRRNPIIHKELIGVYVKVKKDREVYAELVKYARSYSKSSEWYEENSKDADAIKLARVTTENLLRKYGSEYHKTAQEKQDKELYAYSGKIYELYLQHFPEDKNAYDISFFLAEVFFYIKDYEKADVYYKKVIDDKTHDQHRIEAAYGLVLARERISYRDIEEERKSSIVKSEELKKGAVGAVVQPKEIPDKEMKLIEACDLYASLVKESTELPDILFNAARIYFKYDKFPEARQRFLAIINRYPKHDISILSASLVLDALSYEKLWDELTKQGSVFLAKKDLGDQKFKNYIKDIIEGAKFKQIFEKKDEAPGNLAQAFENFVYSHPRSRLGDKAYYNAIINYEKTRNFKKVKSASLTFLKSFPNSDLYPKVLLKLSNLRENIADFEGAAQGYEELSAKYPAHEESKTTLYNAITLRIYLGQYDKALANCDTYIKKYPQDSEIPKVHFFIAQIYVKQKNTKAAVAKYTEIINTNKDNRVALFQASAELALFYLKDGKIAEGTDYADNAKMHYQKLEKKDQNSFLTLYAELRFQVVGLTFNEFQNIKLKLPQNVLKDLLRKKAALLNTIKDSYLEIISLGEPTWGIAALYMIGYVYEDFSKTLFNAPIPAGLTDAQKEEYKLSLEDQAFPIEDKAVEAYEKAIQKSLELKVYEVWTEYSLEHLIKFKPDKFIPIPHLAELRSNYIPLFDVRIIDPKGALQYTIDPQFRQNIDMGKEYLYSKKDFVNAEKIFREVLRRDVLNVTAYHYLAYTKYLANDYKAAITLYLDILKMKPKDMIAEKNISILYFNSNNSKEALIHYRKMYDSDKSEEVILNLAELYRINHYFNESKKLMWDILINNPENVRAFDILCRNYILENNYELTKLAFEVAFRSNPNTPELEHSYSQSLIAFKNYTEAHFNLMEAYKAKKVKEVYRDLGVFNLYFRNYRQAIVYFEEYVATGVDDKYAQFFLGFAYNGEKDYNKSIQIFNTLLAAYPTDDEITYILGTWYYENIRDYGKAKMLFERVQKISSEGGMFYNRASDYLQKIEMKEKTKEAKK